MASRNTLVKEVIFVKTRNILRIIASFLVEPLCLNRTSTYLSRSLIKHYMFTCIDRVVRFLCLFMYASSLSSIEWMRLCDWFVCLRSRWALTSYQRLSEAGHNSFVTICAQVCIACWAISFITLPCRMWNHHHVITFLHSARHNTLVWVLHAVIWNCIVQTAFVLASLSPTHPFHPTHANRV